MPRLRVYPDPGATVTPPAVVIGLPVLVSDSGCVGPRLARFKVAVIVSADERAAERLWDLVPLVEAAIWTVQDAVTAPEQTPGVFTNGGLALPSYELSVEVGL